MTDMNVSRSLIAFVGMRDPYPEQEEEPGPILAYLVSQAETDRPVDEAWLLCTGGDFIERARDLEFESRSEGLKTKFIPVSFSAADVIDYAAIWAELQRSLAHVKEKAGSLPRDWCFLLDSGTPQMKTTLFLAARSGLFPATLIQGIPPRFAGGSYKCREVRLQGMPEIRVAPGPDQSVAAPFASARATAAVAAPAIAAVTGAPPIAASPAFSEVLRRAKSAARYDEPVLLLGETGTGKTMIARRIHEESERSGGPFIEVNCSAIAAELAESELFGHKKGAFTGADSGRTGKFRAAHDGTLFLDEVGDLSLELQAKLLKAIEDKAVCPVGSDDVVPADARLIAATNRDLKALVKARLFRHDLYERLKVVVIELPPLRERREEIRPLAEFFVASWNAQYQESRRLTEEAMLLLESYSWPGNVRELQNSLRAALNIAKTEVVGPESLSDDIRIASSSTRCAEESPVGEVAIPDGGFNLKAKLLQIEWGYVSAALRQTDRNCEAAAKLLGMTGHTLRKALRERFAAFVDNGWEDGM
jgi:DNA-binding NtrC family response regulator